MRVACSQDNLPPDSQGTPGISGRLDAREENVGLAKKMWNMVIGVMDYRAGMRWRGMASIVSGEAAGNYQDVDSSSGSRVGRMPKSIRMGQSAKGDAVHAYVCGMTL